MYWSFGAEVYTLVVGLIGINMWKVQMTAVEEATGMGDGFFGALFYRDAADVARRQTNRLIWDQIWILILTGWAYYVFKKYADWGKSYGLA
jgi:hypothetical protein